MVLRLLFILAFLSTSAWADFNLEQFTPEISMCLEEDILQTCAAELCGPPNQYQSRALQEDTFEKYVTKEGMEALPGVKDRLEKLLKKKVAENLKSIQKLKQQVADKSLFPKFNKLTEREWNDLAVTIYQTHLGFNPFNPPEGPANANSPVSEIVTKGLRDFALVENCSSDVCRAGIESYMTEDLYGRKLEELMLKVSSPNLVNERLPYCLSNYAARNLKKDQYPKILSSMPKMYEQYITTAMSGYSEHSKGVFRKYLKENLELKFIKRSKSTDEFFLDVQRAEKTDRSRQLPIHQMMLYRSENNTMDPLADLEDICPSDLASIGRDAFSFDEDDDGTRQSILFISLGSQIDPASGEGIIFHELSHVLSFLFEHGKMSKSSTAQFLKIRECAKSLSPQDEPFMGTLEIAHQGDHKCTEEDFADVVAYKAIGTKAGPLMGCSILKTTSDRTEYEKIDMNAKNGHSAKLVRILREAIHRNRSIPKSCQKVMEENKSKYTFKKCF